MEIELCRPAGVLQRKKLSDVQRDAMQLEAPVFMFNDVEINPKCFPATTTNAEPVVGMLILADEVILIICCSGKIKPETLLAMEAREMTTPLVPTFINGCTFIEMCE
jgi:hypothetical protein